MPQHRELCLVTPLSLFFILFSLNVATAIAGDQNPFSPKGYLTRYWNKEVRNDAVGPTFLLSKASPLSAVQSASFAKLASENALQTKLPEFCSAAKLLCFPDLGESLEKHVKDASFTGYSGRNFTNYGTDRLAGADSFKNYSLGENLPVDSFRRYSRDSVNHKDKFNNYAADGNVIDQSFNSYAAGATSGTGDFKRYADSTNVPNLRFTSYSDDSNGRAQSFTAYSENANAGQQSFTSYAKHGNGAPNEFTGYGTSSNVAASDFTGYSESGNGINDTFTNYGNDENNPTERFKSYGDGGNAGSEKFSNYRDKANVGESSFQSYGKNSNSDKVSFVNYGKSFNNGSESFTGYGKGSQGGSVGFKIYGFNNTFKDYKDKKSAKFTEYVADEKTSLASASGSLAKRWVEPGKFFRESMLKKGTVMPFPDIKDKMPERSFLPRTISSKLPFATAKLSELKRIFHAEDNSTMEKIITDALQECERAPSKGETKRCVASAEDMIDFATSVLGRNVVVRTTDNVSGAKGDIVVGSVKGINGGKVTQSVSCHQSLFPYLLYYCHSVPKVRVYEADLLDPTSKAKINHGVAICHLDTSAWSPTHGSFAALGSGPGRIEVCHWIFQNDLTWTIAD
ncbi:PREDICTED: probable polygalacturonase non-catalytic subunit JP650 [Fragaria vesca subsp. vesca]|uniref:probable polygalacturonase non-catalytic subunit JP650 n=1 Tax=Fragaria vesca subsp. vesca TaxID=101020 RepID=UPI0002C3722A|nr:PREDICTED: probable polygalacturonase non-catalytic subunit JP650 [Fragaria vesca subsp. vesca]